MIALLLAAAALRPPFAPLPSWFDDLPVESSVPSSRSIDRLLSQRELHLGSAQEVFRSVKRINTVEGAEEAAQLQVDYDPEWQSVRFHRARIRRASGTVEALASADFRILTREAGFEQKILDGSKQAVLVLHDVRPGDELDVAWSVSGAMPQLAGHIAERLYLARENPIGRLYARAIVPAEHRVILSLRNGASNPVIREHAGVREYLWDLKDTAPVLLEADTPSWFEPYPVVDLTDFETWGDVARWGLSLVALEQPLPDSVEAVIAPWRKLPAEQRADAAIRFVREQIRYFGMENGIHAHRAHPPAVVLARRFGDCKDKALLLVTMLRALGITADVALANPSLRAALDDRPPGPFAFNHAIVRADIAGQPRWIDPTRSSQRGSVSALPRLPYARALVLEPSTKALSRLPDPVESDSSTLVEETWSVRNEQGDGTLLVKTTWSGLTAEERREVIPSRSPEQTAKSYLAYYRENHPGIEMIEQPTFHDDPEANRFGSRESYRVPRFWASGEHGFEAEMAQLQVPQGAASRTQPLSLRYPWYAVQRTRIELPEADWDLPDEVHRFESPGLRAEIKEHLAREPSGPVYVVSTEVLATADFIPASEVERYAKAVRDLRNAARIRVTLQHRSRTQVASPIIAWEHVGALLVFFALVGVALVGGARVMAKIERSRARRFLRKTQPGEGESAVTPLRASTVLDVQRFARRRRCMCGRSHQGTSPQPGESVLAGDRTVHSVKLPCPCGEVAVVYFVEISG